MRGTSFGNVKFVISAHPHKAFEAISPNMTALLVCAPSYSLNPFLTLNNKADINPIGGISKTDLKRFIAYARDAFDMPVLTRYDPRIISGDRMSHQTLTVSWMLSQLQNSNLLRLPMSKQTRYVKFLPYNSDPIHNASLGRHGNDL
jgi:hypothetical protein